MDYEKMKEQINAFRDFEGHNFIFQRVILELILKQEENEKKIEMLLSLLEPKVYTVNEHPHEFIVPKEPYMREIKNMGPEQSKFWSWYTKEDKEE